MYDKGLIRVNPNGLEDFRLTAMRFAARTVARWRKDYGDKLARQLVLEHLAGDVGPVFRDAYLTAFGH